MNIQQNNNSRFYHRAYELSSHGHLTKITVPGMKFPPVEQASNPIRKHLVISLTIMPYLSQSFLKSNCFTLAFSQHFVIGSLFLLAFLWHI